ncbi:hypothetical protein SESBI_19460 [Sesbania bispinosa]|nr:hypothetical protein SESBI_19460 [Sesbania bispinosa]
MVLDSGCRMVLDGVAGRRMEDKQRRMVGGCSWMRTTEHIVVGWQVHAPRCERKRATQAA